MESGARKALMRLSKSSKNLSQTFETEEKLFFTIFDSV